jgi:uncharacterized protein (DUF488 family)
MRRGPLADIFTIGAYGWSEGAFFAALKRAGIATVCDVRQRRGVRGSEYAFANSNRLQARLADLGITYVHRLDLAPTTGMRQAQYAADDAAGVGKRSRTALGEAFVDAYRRERLDDFDPKAFLADVATGGPVVLFCVERDATACHRGLIASELAAAGANVTHLTP